tara:strand:+ start:138 stop:287 length:150 start_codon:yes stop_codon:yes gene_type:complete
MFDLIKAENSLGESCSRFIMWQLVEALEHLQEKGVCHCDLKLENILHDP